MIVILVCAIALLAIGIIGIAYAMDAFGGSKDSDDDGGDSTPDYPYDVSGGGASSSDSQPPIPAPTPRPPPPPTTTTTTTQAPLPDTPILCTLSRAVASYQYPPPNTCNLIFITHVYCENFKDASPRVQGILTTPFNFFKKMALDPKYGQTRFGISVHERYATECGTTFNTDAELSALYDANIKHYGLLSVTLQPDQSVINLLQRFKAVQKSKNPEYGSVVIGIRGKYGLAPSFGSWIQAVKDKGYDIIVLHTHISSWNVTGMTGTSGASSWTSTTHAYASMIDVIVSVNPTAFSTNATFMLSLTMGVQTFQMKKTDSVTQLTIKPLSATMSSFAETCASGLTAKTEDLISHFMITGSTTTHVQYIYDSSDTIKTKGNKVKEAITQMGIKVKRGWAIFDVELDDPANVCKKSRSFDRLIEVVTALGKMR
ncbi:uncharacterized protein LOC135383347 [Ornithodoros turicata]|uniref:uncharacterized protein LOC135383347 n=1 Tax=Ornithodoros turicata TaxID=34597 RepID=UPI0031395166